MAKSAKRTDTGSHVANSPHQDTAFYRDAGRAAVPKSRLSLDAWAVTLALALAALIWSGVIKHIPW